MWRIIPYAILQSILLTGGQVFFKYAMMRMPAFSWSRVFFTSLLVNWQFAACGLFFGAASLLWAYIVKNFPFSASYPMLSLSYVFGMFAAIIFFHEQIPLERWLGVFLILTGCVLIAK